jgi:hypothetical protein
MRTQGAPIHTEGIREVACHVAAGEVALDPNARAGVAELLTLLAGLACDLTPPLPSAGARRPFVWSTTRRAPVLRLSSANDLGAVPEVGSRRLDGWASPRQLAAPQTAA